MVKKKKFPRYGERWYIYIYINIELGSVYIYRCFVYRCYTYILSQVRGLSLETRRALCRGEALLAKKIKNMSHESWCRLASPSDTNRVKWQHVYICRYIHAYVYLVTLIYIYIRIYVYICVFLCVFMF